uniref:CPG4 domain-containing protein n=1 Tax=Panagrellus redivivus TaxID=6233 RepID=A0A7E4UWH0_PANRE
MRLWKVTLILCLGLGCAVGAEPASPVFRYDEGATNNIFSSLFSMFREEGFNLTHLVNVFEPTLCVRNCMPDLAETMTTTFRDAGVNSASLFLKDAWSGLSTSQICRKMEETNKCIDSAGRCSDSVVELIGQTFKYLCMDHRKLLNETLPCIRKQAEAASQVCDATCKVAERMINVIDQKNTSTPTVGAVKEAVVNDMVDVCNSSMCYIACLQKRIDEKCAGKTELLVNTIFKTLASGGNDGKHLKGLGEILTNALPAKCHYLLKERKPRPGHKSIPWMLGDAMNRPSSVGVVAENPAKSGVRVVQPTKIPIPFNDKTYTLSCHLFDEKNEPFEMRDVKYLANLLYKHLEKTNARADESDPADDMSEMRFESGIEVRRHPDCVLPSNSTASSAFVPMVIPFIIGYAIVH